MANCDDGYTWPEEDETYDFVGYHDSVSISGYEPYDLDTYGASYTISEVQEPKLLGLYHHAQDFGYHYDHNSFSSSSTPHMNYSAYNYIEPKLIVYEPVSSDTGLVSYHTQYSISFPEMDSKFNEPEFEEYDPTPYDGGYDIVSVYGKPLPPSDQTCYPRSNPKPVELKSEPVATPIPLVIPNPEPQHESGSDPQPEPMHIPVLMPTPIPVPIPLVEPEPETADVPAPLAEPLESKELGEMDREECSYPDYRFDYPWPEYDHGYGIGVGYDYRYGKQVVQVPPWEYNSEVVDLCENIFGSWPCLARIRKQQMDVNNKPITCPQNGLHNPWEECATYIFGWPVTSYDQ